MPREKTATYNRTVQYFDGNLNLVKEKVSGTAPVAEDYASGIKMLQDMGADLLEIVNDAIKALAIEKSTDEILKTVTGAVSERAVEKVLGSFRMIPPYASEKEPKQTEMLLELARTQPFLKDAILATQKQLDEAAKK